MLKQKINEKLDKLRSIKQKLNLKRVLQLVWSLDSKLTVLTVIMILTETLLYMGLLFVSRKLVVSFTSGNFSPAERQRIVFQNLGYICSLAIAYVTFKALSGYVAEIQGARLSRKVDNKIHECSVALDVAFYESPAYFDTLQRAKQAGADRPNAIVMNLVDIVKNILTSGVIATVMFTISWMLIPILFVFTLPTLFVRIRFSNKMFRWRLLITPIERKSYYYSSLISEQYIVKEIRSFGLGAHFRNMYDSIQVDLMNQRLKMSKEGKLYELFTSIFGTVGVFSCMALLCYKILKGSSDIGDMTLIVVLIPQSFAVLQSIISGISTLYQNNVFVNYIFELFDLKPTLVETENPLELPLATNLDLVMSNVSFQYPHADFPTLNNISLKIPSGKIVAIVGLNGAGKTTIIKLLTRMYDPTSGALEMGGIDIRNYSTSDYRKQVSAVFQDFGRYNVTVKENILLGDIDGVPNEAKIIAAATNSGAHEYIREFPNQYDTMMGRLFDDGHEVSIGQWQKLAIARALYRDSRFIILDEATSALDALAEQELFSTFRERIGNRGALIISHRLSAVKHADYIYVIGDGIVKQEGTHQELLNKPGAYSQLFQNEL